MKSHIPQSPAQSSYFESIASKLPIISLFIFNLLPLAGVIYLHWNVLFMMLLYWSESLIIGFFTIFKILLAQQSSPPPKRYLEAHPDYKPTPLTKLALKLFLVPFFCIHFGLFMLVHAIFIFTFISAGNLDSILIFLGGITGDYRVIAPYLLPFAGLFAYHLINFIFNYLRPKAYQVTSPMAEMFTPYPRVVFTHVVLIIVSALSITLSTKIAPVFTAGIIVILKTYLDLYMYRRAMSEDHLPSTSPRS